MPEVSKAPRRWIITSLIIILLALVAIFAVVRAGQASRKANEAATVVLALQVQAEADAKLKALEKRAAKARAQSACRQAIKGREQGRLIVEDLRSTYLELAGNTTNMENAAVLRRRAKNLPKFPSPKCDPGPKPKKASKGEG